MDQRIGRSAATGLGLAVAALLISAALNYSNINAIATREAAVVHTHEVLDGLNRIWATVKDGERGQRGYIITGDPAYLEPYTEATAKIGPLLEQMDQLVADNPRQKARGGALREAVELRLQTLANGVEQQRQQGFEGGRAFVQQGDGRAQMLAIEQQVNEMITAEQALLRSRIADTRTIYGTAYFTAILTTVVGLVLVGAVYWLTARAFAERARVAEELERRVEQRTLELNQTNAALQISNRELEQFASVASHDLQEPLRKIEAFGDRLKSRSGDRLDDQGHDFLNRILTSAARMRSLINDLLTFSRITTKAQPPQLLQLQEIAREVASDLEGRLQLSGGRIEVGTLPQIEGDPLQMRQLLQNLIGNGLKFQKPGVPPVVRVEGEVQQEDDQPARCILTVQDNGIGFEEIYLDRIFNVFQRLHGRNEYEGTGMGLAICRKIVERHGGTITAKSAPDQGARFIVTLPVIQGNKEPAV